MFEHKNKVSFIKSLEEKLNKKFFLHKDTKIHSEYLVDKMTGETMFVFSSDKDFSDVDYVSGLLEFVYEV